MPSSVWRDDVLEILAGQSLARDVRTSQQEVEHGRRGLALLQLLMGQEAALAQGVPTPTLFPVCRVAGALFWRIRKGMSSRIHTA